MSPLRCSSSTPASAARLFVQLSCSRRAATAASSSSSSSSSSILEILLPRSSLSPAARSFHNDSAGSRKGGLRSGAASSPTPPLAVPTTPRRNTHTISDSRSRVLDSSSVITPRHRPHRALFSTTAAVRRTEVVYNPQQDEDGSEMLMEITPRAANRLSKIMAQDKNPDLALRIQVESGGCHGFQYLMSLTTIPPLPSSSPSPSPSSPPPPPLSPPEVAAAEVTPSTTTTSNTSSTPELREDDTVFAFVKDGEGDAEGDAVPAPAPKIVLDGPSLQLLRGSKVDYTMELIGSQFKITDNPHATSSCGCGTSFDIKDL